MKGRRRAAEAVAVLLLVGCGGDRELSAEEMVVEFNTNSRSDASLTLGEGLIATEAAAGEVFVLELTVPGEFSTEAQGSLVVLDNSDEALVEFNRCESSVSFVCYRASNIVLRFEDLDPTGQSVVARTLQAISDAAQ